MLGGLKIICSKTACYFRRPGAIGGGSERIQLCLTGTRYGVKTRSRAAGSGARYMALRRRAAGRQQDDGRSEAQNAQTHVAAKAIYFGLIDV
jgi:hypothetical protein